MPHRHVIVWHLLMLCTGFLVDRRRHQASQRLSNRNGRSAKLSEKLLKLLFIQNVFSNQKNHSMPSLRHTILGGVQP